MAHKTILVHVDESARAPMRIRLAAELARMQGAHLIGAAVTGVSRFIYSNGINPGEDVNLAAHMKMLTDKAQHAAAAFTSIAKDMGLASYQSVISHDEAGGGIGNLARYADLVVVGQTSRDEPAPSVPPDFAEYVILHSGRPTLVIPYLGQYDTIAKRPLIAWDAGREATRAVNDALPLLRLAGQAQVVIFNPDSLRQKADAQSGEELALYLKRHGVDTQVFLHQSNGDVGEALLALALDLDTDMLVMGAYGHSRFREMIMGGVTRTLLEGMKAPVLMSH
jgi:nucleotide-binding universal stress UspA family protein